MGGLKIMNHDVRRLRIDVDNLESNYKSMDYESYYLLTDDNSTIPSKDDVGWSTTLPQDVKDKYLWIMNVIDTGVSKLKTEPFCTSMGGGESITDMDIEFIQTKSRTTPPTQSDDGWSTDAPTHLVGRYIWSRTKIISNYGVKYSEPVCITGDSNVETSQGLLCGTKDNSPLYMHIRYCTINNPSDISQTSLQPQKYIGYYVDGDVVDSADVSKYSWKIRPDNGISYTLDNITYYMHIKYAYDNIGTGLNETGGSFIGYYYDNNSSDSTDVSKYFYFKIESKGILNIYEEYAISNNYTTSPTVGWSTTKPSITNDKPYLWSRNLIRYTDNSTQPVNVLCLSALDGDDVHYIFCRTLSSNPPDTPTKSTTIYTNQSNNNDEDAGKWFEDPQGINNKFIYEWVSKQLKINGVWSQYSKPSLWAKYSFNGEDGKTPQLYIKYSKTANPTSMSELVDVETEGYDYQGLAWTYNNTAPTSVDDYKPFTIYDPQDGTPAPEGFVHFAYADDDKGATRFTTGKCDGRKYIGTCYDNQQSDPQEAKRYKWALIKGEDGKKPTTAEITEVIEQTNVDASTLEGKNPSSFLPSEIPVKYIYRDDNDKSKNMLRIYPLGNLMIIDVYNFSKGTANYGQDSQNTAYFNLLPDNKKLDPKYCPATSVFINDLNNADGSGNGRLRLTSEGRVTKLGTESNGYSNTYGTFIYPIIPRIPTTLIVPSGKAYDYGDYFSMTLKDKDNNPVSNVNLTFELFGIYYQRKTDTNGVAKLQLRINPQTGLSLGGVFNGDTIYAPSDNIRYGENSVVKTTGNITINRSGRQITIIVKNSNGNTLPNIELVFDGGILYTNENGEAYTTVDTNKTYNCSFGSSTSHVFSNPSFTKSITVNDLADPVITLTKVPFYMTAAGSSGANKEYVKDSLSIGRVQNKEDTPDAGNAVRCIHNGSGYGYHVTPAQIYFNGFGLPKPSTKCVLTAKVWCGEFGGITGGSMPYPKLQIKDVVNNIVYKEEVISGVFNSSNKNVYLPLTVSWDFTGDNRDIVASDNLAILVIPQRSSLNTNESYNKSEFRIDYVEVTAQIQ